MLKQTLPPSRIHQGDLILVNQQYAYAPKKDPALQQQRRAALLLHRLLEDIGAKDQITPVSGLRSRYQQQEIYDSALQEHGWDFTRQYVAQPGHSEHQTGLAIDLGLNQGEINFLCPAFPYEGICQIFRERAARYGFVERYGAGKQAVTGISHEPWHFRYVGIPHADIMEKMGFALEEYHQHLRQFPYGEKTLEWQMSSKVFSISYLAALPGQATPFEAPMHKSVWISGNNMDGFIITQWREKYA